MTLSEARKILGLGPDEDPRPHLTEFQSARERIAELVRSAPNETLGDRYQQGLVEFDKALAAVREYLEALGLSPARNPQGEPSAEETPAVEEEENEAEPEAEEAPEPFRIRGPSILAWTAVFLIGVGGGGLLYYKNEETKNLQRQARIALLERIGSEYIENRRWQEAANSFFEIETLDPDSELAKLGRRSIEAGMAEEQTQYVGYWTGQAIAELEAGRLDEADAATLRILDKFPREKEVLAIRGRIAEAREQQSHRAILAAGRELLGQRKWDEAISTAQRILDQTPDDPEARMIVADAQAALTKKAADQTRAKELLVQALVRDQGQFDQLALDWLREAASLDPDNAEIAARLEKMASYTRTLRVPGDFDTPAEALAVARDRDRVVLAEQTWKGPLVINAAVELQGAGPDKTIVECPASDGSAISIGPDARGARVTGISFRHEAFQAIGSDRFSAALVRGGGVTFVDCHFHNASGHGLAVIESGEVIATRCQFSDNGWNGAAAIGKGCLLEVRESEALNNFEHGIESWDGAAVTLIKNRCEGNSRNGIHADNHDSATTIVGNQLIANREFGLVLGSAGSGKIANNTARSNLLGGFVIRAAAAALPVTGNEASLNKGPGIVLEEGLSATAYAENKCSNNQSKQILTDAKLVSPGENDAAEPDGASR